MAHPATRPYLTIGPIGSTGRTVRVLRYYDPASPVWGHRVYAGCWSGTLDQLAARIEPGGGHGWATAVEGQCRAEYEGAISLARLRVAAWSVPLTEEERKAREGRPAGVDLRRANLYGADLRRANLDGANLYGAYLYSANLRRADLYGADLRGADLRRANLDGANLYGAYLDGADLYGAYLYSADLDGANLRGADLRGADLRRANLDGANLDSAHCDGLTRWPSTVDQAARGVVVMP